MAFRGGGRDMALISGVEGGIWLSGVEGGIWLSGMEGGSLGNPDSQKIILQGSGSRD